MRFAWESKQRAAACALRQRETAIDRNGSAEHNITRRQQQYSSRRKPQNERNTYLFPLFVHHYYHRLPFHIKRKMPERQISPSHAMEHGIHSACGARLNTGVSECDIQRYERWIQSEKEKRFAHCFPLHKSVDLLLLLFIYLYRRIEWYVVCGMPDEYGSSSRCQCMNDCPRT